MTFFNSGRTLIYVYINIRHLHYTFFLTPPENTPSDIRAIEISLKSCFLPDMNSLAKGSTPKKDDLR